MYMDDIKLCAKNEKELETLIQSLRIYSQDIGMEFGKENCIMLIMRKRETTYDRKNRTTKSRKNQNTWREEKLTKIREADIIKQVEMKEKSKRVFQENEKTTQNQII